MLLVEGLRSAPLVAALGPVDRGVACLQSA